MTAHSETIRQRLSSGPLPASRLAESLRLSQPTISRALSELGDDIVRIGVARSVRYALRDTLRGGVNIPVYRVDSKGHIRRLGDLIPVRPEGFVMRQEDGLTLHYDDLPWWMADMRPQGYLGRAYAHRYAMELSLPERLSNWTSTHVLRALLAQGHDVVGDLLLGDSARERFLSSPAPDPILSECRAETYVRLAQETLRGDVSGSSAGGEQAKFTAYVMTPAGPRHVLVKFSEPEENPATERWRDLLLAEHLALETLRSFGIPAAETRILDHAGQRFLEVDRFDRIGPLGRSSLVSLTSLDAEFSGKGGDWLLTTQSLIAEGILHQEALTQVGLLWAFGALIGNTDMHGGNLSFTGEHGLYKVAPAYDMLPMAFRPCGNGSLPERLPEANIRASVANEAWRDALVMAKQFLKCLRAMNTSQRLKPCIFALEHHIGIAASWIKRIG